MVLFPAYLAIICVVVFMDTPENPLSLREKLNLETAKISWHELQRFYAAGNVVLVDGSLDLMTVAEALVADDTAQFSAWMADNKVSGPTPEQAQAWYDADAVLWAMVIAPWVLVQTVENA